MLGLFRDIWEENVGRWVVVSRWMVPLQIAGDRFQFKASPK